MDVEMDELVPILLPILVYWVYSGFYMIPTSWEKYRLHPVGEEDVRNLVTKGQVVRGVLLQQAIQVLMSFTVLWVDKAKIRATKHILPSLPAFAFQLAVAMFVLDTWQYFMHRLMHTNRFLYKHVHSQHHSLIVPYAIGALYNHPVEGFLLDTVGGALSFLLSRMTPLTGTLFFCITTIKTVDDHCGLFVPGNPIQRVFTNNSAYHSVHHQLYGQKYNYSQPFFVVWDKVFGTHMDYELVERKGGGLEAKPNKPEKRI